MAQKVVTELVDDISGEEATETVSFGYRGKSYEIDLSEDNAKLFDEALCLYLEHARPVKGVSAPVKRARADGNREQNQAVRDWARSRGLKCSDRGRIPADTLAAYEEAHAA